MNKILLNTLVIFLIIGLSGCSYKPIFVEKNYGFEIEKINFEGERNVNRIIESKLKFIKSSGNKEKKKYTIEIVSSKNKKIVSKDSKGDPLKFEINILQREQGICTM